MSASGNVWFAGLISPQDESPIFTSGEQWRVYLQVGPFVHPLGCRFLSKEAAEMFILAEVLGATADCGVPS